MPETFVPTCQVELTMPLATVSHTVVRSVSLDGHDDPDRVEKFVRYVARCQFQVEIDYVQVSDLNLDAIVDVTNVDPEESEAIPDVHKSAFEPQVALDANTGYRIDFSALETGGAKLEYQDSNSDEEEDKEKKSTLIQIDMKGYGY